MTTIILDNKKIANILLKVFGGSSPKVQSFHHEAEQLKIDILSVKKVSDDDLTSYGTIGLSDFPMKWGTGEFPTRIELVGACLSSFESFPNILASAAFNIIRSNVVCHPGVAMRDYVKIYQNNTCLPHLYFTDPFY